MFKFKLSLLILCLFFFSCNNDEQAIDTSGLLLKAERYHNPGVYDQQGRYMLLRGVNLNTLGDYWEANPNVPATAPYEADHFRLMASYGFNVVRLLVHWSELEPERGQYNYEYIAEIQQAIEDAANQGIYTLLDMHQDAWGKYVASSEEENCEFPAVGWDGAPLWATLDEGASTCKEGSRESAPIVATSFRNLWNNTDGIQDAFIAMWQELVRNTAHYPMVVGYDAFNEPSLGNGSYFTQGNRYATFLDKLVKAIRVAENESGGLEHIFFFETTVTWNGQEVPATPGFGFTNDDNIVFAPHNYFEVIIQDLLTLEQGAQLFQTLANQYGTHCFIGEWGVFNNLLGNLPKLKRFAVVEDEFLMGSTWWQWCQAPGDPHGINWAGDSYSQTSLHLVEIDASGNYTGVINELYLNVLGRSRPLAIHGKPVTFSSNPDDGTMYLKAKSDVQGETILWVSDRFGTPIISGVGVELNETLQVEGGYHVSVKVDGVYEVAINF